MSKSLPPHITLTDRFVTAVLCATTMHREQTRKSTTNPYICHPLGVASLVLEVGGDEDQAIAALLHDVAEDCGGEPRLQEIKDIFGDRVEAIVRGCSDSIAPKGAPKVAYEIRKRAHLDHLEVAEQDILLVTAADKLHNARAIVTDLQTIGSEVWSRFNGEPDEIIHFYREVLVVLETGKITDNLLVPLESAIDFMEAHRD
jgi:(p)ppGpp synthase/HD superfamily hydrolase